MKYKERRLSDFRYNFTCNLSSSSRREEKRKVVQTMINKLYCGSFNKRT